MRPAVKISNFTLAVYLPIPVAAAREEEEEVFSTEIATTLCLLRNNIIVRQAVLVVAFYKRAQGCLRQKLALSARSCTKRQF
jgi:hypothetical protein